MTAFWLGDHEAIGQISAALAADCRRHGMAGWLPGALQGLTMAQILSGEWTQARASAGEGLRLAHAMAQSQRAAFLCDLLGLLAALTGDERGSLDWLAEYGRLGGDAATLTAHRHF